MLLPPTSADPDRPPSCIALAHCMHPSKPSDVASARLLFGHEALFIPAWPQFWPCARPAMCPGPLPTTSRSSVTSTARSLSGVTDRDDFARENLSPPPDESPARPEEMAPPPRAAPPPDQDRFEPAPDERHTDDPGNLPREWSGPPSEEPLTHTPPGYPPAPPPAGYRPLPAPPEGTGYAEEDRGVPGPRHGAALPQLGQQPGHRGQPPANAPRRGRQWPSGPAEADSTTAAPPTGWNYVDAIPTNELVPIRKVPPARGWRRVIYNATFRRINPGRSQNEVRQAELETRIHSRLRGQYKIGVLGKGGVGKTTVAACVGSIFAQLRPEDRVVAIDADTSFGRLASRIDPDSPGSYWDLAADEQLDTFADLRTKVGNNADGLFVLPGGSATAQRRVLDSEIYRQATARLDRHFTISIIDCGAVVDSPVTLQVLRDVDALIVVSSPWVDGASAAAQTMEWLAALGMRHLMHRTVVVLNDSDGHADQRTRTILAQQFANQGHVVIKVPFDSHLRPGGVIDINNEMSPKTRRRFYEIAAAIADHFASTISARASSDCGDAAGRSSVSQGKDLDRRTDEGGNQ